MRHRSKVSSVVYIAAGLISIIMGIVVLMMPGLFGQNEGAMRFLFAGMLMLYGGWRLYTGLSQLKQQDQNPTT